MIAMDGLHSATHFVERPSGRMEVFATWPDAAGPLPVVVILMDMWGFRQTVKEIAGQVARLGYYALLPDFYYQTDPVRLDDEAKDIVVRKYTDMPPGVQRRLRAAMDQLSDDAVVADFGALLQAAAGWGVAMAPHAGVVGYCMGGRHALCIAGAFPDRVRVAACLHGTDLFKDGERSPHLRALRASGEIYAGHAELDEYAPVDVPQRLEAVLNQGNATFRSALHPGARHGYALHDRAIHDAVATARDWDLIEAMLRRQLRPA